MDTLSAGIPPIGRVVVVKYVLFMCNHNAGRSQMAQAFFERDAPADVRAESAGTNLANHVLDLLKELLP